MDCGVHCVWCDKLADYKVNHARVHGLCGKHKQYGKLPCKRCNCSIDILFHSWIERCQICEENPFSNKCTNSHLVCKYCFDENFCRLCACKHCGSTYTPEKLNCGHSLCRNCLQDQDFLMASENNCKTCRPLETSLCCHCKSQKYSFIELNCGHTVCLGCYEKNMELFEPNLCLDCRVKCEHCECPFVNLKLNCGHSLCRNCLQDQDFLMASENNCKTCRPLKTSLCCHCKSQKYYIQQLNCGHIACYQCLQSNQTQFVDGYCIECKVECRDCKRLCAPVKLDCDHSVCGLCYQNKNGCSGCRVLKCKNCGSDSLAIETDQGYLCTDCSNKDQLIGFTSTAPGKLCSFCYLQDSSNETLKCGHVTCNNCYRQNYTQFQGGYCLNCLTICYWCSSTQIYCELQCNHFICQKCYSAQERYLNQIKNLCVFCHETSKAQAEYGPVARFISVDSCKECGYDSMRVEGEKVFCDRCSKKHCRYCGDTILWKISWHRGVCQALGGNITSLHKFKGWKKELKDCEGCYCPNCRRMQAHKLEREVIRCIYDETVFCRECLEILPNIDTPHNHNL